MHVYLSEIREKQESLIHRLRQDSIAANQLAEHPAEAESYAKVFEWEGKSFKVMLQNRVNMEDTEVVPDGNNRGSEYFVTAKEENIRPYGILVKEI